MMLDTMKAWLQTFPRWEGTLEFDYADGVPGSTGLYPQGITELSAREDVLGTLRLRLSVAFQLRRRAGQSQDNAQWLLDLQNWVMAQDRAGLAPRFGDEPTNERLRAFEGRLDSHTSAGGSLYTVLLTAEFTKIFRGE